MKSVYTGGEKVAEFESYDELRVGDNNPAFIYEGSELVYPNPVKDGLVLWYDFSGRKNTDSQRGIAEDLSGNGNHGTLQNFNYTAESGYDKNKLLFDGVDDYISSEHTRGWIDSGKITVDVIFKTNFKEQQVLVGKGHTEFEVAINPNGHLSSYHGNGSEWVASAINGSNLNDGKVKLLTLVFKKDIGVAELYINGNFFGERIQEVLVDLTGFGNNAFEVGQRIGGRFRFKGDIYSTRIYNRPLTPEEIAHNYALEKERFGIE